jgi:hypothetical protein
MNVHGEEFYGYEVAMEETNSFNWQPPEFKRDPYVAEDIYCCHCHRMLNASEFYYCFDCREECWAGWGS